MAVNDITGDKLISRIASKEFVDNYDAIFRKTMKVYIGKDDIYEHFMWDEEMLQALEITNGCDIYKTIEVPMSLVQEYRDFCEKRKEIQAKLEKYYESNRPNKEATGS